MRVREHRFPHAFFWLTADGLCPALLRPLPDDPGLKENNIQNHSQLDGFFAMKISGCVDGAHF
ncbi:hypothetical protein TH8_21170 [Thalassospira profundimaris]|nr:hypothetical protein TH8_21170 [Thalassospira profundimaris]